MHRLHDLVARALRKHPLTTQRYRWPFWVLERLRPLTEEARRFHRRPLYFGLLPFRLLLAARLHAAVVRDRLPFQVAALQHAFALVRPLAQGASARSVFARLRAVYAQLPVPSV